MTTAQAINALAALTTLALRSAEAAQRVSAMVQQAQSEGRDLSESEAAEIKAMRRDAVQRWEQAGAE